MTGEQAGESLEVRERPQRTLQRMAWMYTPLALVALGLFSVSLWNLIAGNIGAIFPAVFLGVVAFALAYQAVTAIRDLRAEPMTTTGEVQRSWSKGAPMLWFVKSHYLRVAGRIFVVGPVTQLEVHEGDVVQVEHWPHTNTVREVRRLQRAPVEPTRDRRRPRATARSR